MCPKKNHVNFVLKFILTNIPDLNSVQKTAKTRLDTEDIAKNLVDPA